ncbi:MAG: hypothetical protein ABI369_09035, partial [Acetobacteraceae bacterium]
MLSPLLISVRRTDGAGVIVPAANSQAEACVFCGAPLGLHAEDGQGCAICTLVRHLERPRI